MREKQITKCTSRGTGPIVTLNPKFNPKMDMKLWQKYEQNKIGKKHHTRFCIHNPEAVSLPGVYSETSSELTKAVRDFGIQCERHRAPTGGKYFSNSTFTSLISLQRFTKPLEQLCKTLEKEDDKKNLMYIIHCINNIIGNVKNNNTDPSKERPPAENEFGKLCSEKGIQMIDSTNVENIENLEKALLGACEHLQQSCSMTEETSLYLRKEKHSLTKKLFEKIKELEESHKKEEILKKKLNEFYQLIADMSHKIENSIKAIKELEKYITQLTYEKKKLSSIKEFNLGLLSKLSTKTAENEKLHTEIQFMLLERERNRVLIKIKEEKIKQYQDELRKYEKYGGTPKNKSMAEKVNEIENSSADSCSTLSLSEISSAENKELTPMAAKTSTLQKGKSLKGEKGDWHLRSIKDLKNELKDLFTELKSETDLAHLQVHKLTV